VEDDGDGSSTYHLIGDTVTLKLLKGGVITGKVTDESGEPLIKASVGVYRVRDGEGLLSRQPQGSDDAETDDRGITGSTALRRFLHIEDRSNWPIMKKRSSETNRLLTTLQQR